MTTLRTRGKYYEVLFLTPSGQYGVVPDAPLLVYRDQLGAGQGEWHAKLPRTWAAAGIPGDLRGTNDIVISTTGGTKWFVYVIDNTTIGLPGGTTWGDWTWGTSTWGDPPAGLGSLQWQGSIEEVTPTIGQTDETVDVMLLPPAKNAGDAIFQGTKSFVNTDAVEIIHYFFRQNLMPNLSWDPRNVLSGNLVTQSFTYQSFRSIMDFCTTAAGANWVNHIDERGRFRIWKPDTTQPTHVWQVGREVFHTLYTQTLMLQKNRVTVRGKNGVVTVKDSNWTQANTRDVTFNFPDVTSQATLEILAASLLKSLNTVSVRATITLFSDSGNIPSGLPGAVLQGYNLESVRPGDTVRLWIDEIDPTQFIWGEGQWGQMIWATGQTGIVFTPQVIQAVTYQGGDRLDVDLSTLRPHIVAAHRRVQRLAEDALSQQVASV